MKIVADMGFSAIGYDHLAAGRAETGTLPSLPMLIDFDHPVITMRKEVFGPLEG